MKARREQGTVLQNDITRYEFQLQSLELTLTKLTDVSTIINHQLVTTLHLPEQTVIVPDKNELNTEIDARQSPFKTHGSRRQRTTILVSARQRLPQIWQSRR